MFEIELLDDFEECSERDGSRMETGQREGYGEIFKLFRRKGLIDDIRLSEVIES